MSIGYVRVVNARRDMAPDSQPEEGETVITVDRTHPCLGNPFPVPSGRSGQAARTVALARYGVLLANDIKQHGPMSQAIDLIAQRVVAGEKICLQCHCRPLPCHADIIKKEVERRVVQIELALDVQNSESDAPSPSWN